MKVFLSWSGERSQIFAQAMRDWLPLPLHYVQPWISNSDIEAGERWANEVAKELEATNFGIICVTRENVSSPWILFEAGALAKSMEEGRVIPLLLDIEFKDIAGPLAQFQAKKFSKSGVDEIVNSINKTAPSPVVESRLNTLFEMSWPQLEERISKIPQLGTPAKSRPQHEILEELVAGVRGLDVRFRDILEDPQPRSRVKRGRNIEMVIEYALRGTGAKPNDPISIIIITSLIKDSFPWIYDLALEYYRESNSSTRSEKAYRAKRQVITALHMLQRGPLLNVMTDGSKNDYILLKTIIRYLEKEIFTDEEEIMLEMDSQQRSAAAEYLKKEFP